MAQKNEIQDIWVGFDLGGTKMLATVFDHQFKVLGSKRRKTKGYAGAKTGLSRMVQTIDDALEEAGLDRSALNGIGVGCPGPLDLRRGVILDTPNLGWKNVKLRDALESTFGCSAVIGNDVDMGVYGEYRLGAAQGARCVLGLFPGTGIGGGCVYEGKILRGSKSSCMEIGHMVVQRDGLRSGAGLRGTLESVASRLAVSSAAAAAAYRGEAPHLLKAAGTDLTNIRSGVLAASIAAGDRVIEQIVRDAARWIGIGLSSAVHMMAPDVIILGGGMVEAMPHLFKQEVSLALDKHLLASFRKGFSIQIAQLADHAGVLGAAAWAQENFQ